jgi:hypothetical protein
VDRAERPARLELLQHHPLDLPDAQVIVAHRGMVRLSSSPLARPRAGPSQ